MKHLPILLLGLLAQDSRGPAPPTPGAAPIEAAAPRGLTVARPGGALCVPPGEDLVYDVKIRWGPISASVGTVTQTSRVDTYRPALLEADAGGVGVRAAGSSDPAPERAGCIRIHAKGSYTFYSVDTLLEARILPREWPRSTYRMVSRGTERRRSEILMGRRDGRWMASYRRDTRHGAPKGTRIWKEAQFREIPSDTLDMVHAVLMARTLIREDRRRLVFPMLNKLHLWELTLERGREERIQVPAGTFDAVEILIRPRPYPGEEIDPKRRRKFEGLFGMRGDMHLWVDRATGVAVRIQGEVPVGPLALGVDVRLKEYWGTPPDFRPGA